MTLAKKRKEAKRFLGIVLLSVGFVTAGSISAVQAQTLEVRPVDRSQDPAAPAPRRDPARPQRLHLDPARPEHSEDEEDMRRILYEHYLDLRDKGIDPEDLGLQDLGFEDVDLFPKGAPRRIPVLAYCPYSYDAASSHEYSSFSIEGLKPVETKAWLFRDSTSFRAPERYHIKPATRQLIEAYLQKSKKGEIELSEEDVQTGLDTLNDQGIIDQDQYRSIYKIANDLLD
jgi:hypothetical protein